MSLVANYTSGVASETIHCLVKRHDGNYLDTSDGTFKAWASIAGTNARTSLTEDTNVPGRYSATITTTSSAQWTNGIYTVIVRDATPTVVGTDRVYMRTQDETDLLFDI